jgi:hypothetical protein
MQAAGHFSISGLRCPLKLSSLPRLIFRLISFTFRANNQIAATLMTMNKIC